MDFLNMGVPIGQYWGITVRLHFTLLLYAFWQVTAFGSIGMGVAWVVGLFGCILLHEFGHALAAKWCDGECDDILLWPLGGLAFARAAFNPTAHLITTVAGPFVTLVLWLLFAGMAGLTEYLRWHLQISGLKDLHWFCASMRNLNLFLLIFNMLPAFPMDGGRILRDTMWHGMSAEKATRIAINVSYTVAVAAVAWAMFDRLELRGLLHLPSLPIGSTNAFILAFFIFSQSLNEKKVVAAEARGVYNFSVRERLGRGRRSRAFFESIEQRKKGDTLEGFHRCSACGRTENDAPTLDFRVCSDCAGGEEYCQEHLENHKHR